MRMQIKLSLSLPEPEEIKGLANKIGSIDNDTAILNTIESTMKTNLEDDTPLDRLNIIAESIKLLADKHGVNHAFLLSKYDDPEVAVKAINLEGSGILEVIKEKLAKTGKALGESLGDTIKRISVAGDADMKTVSKKLSDTIKHTVKLDDGDWKFVLRSYNSFIQLNGLQSGTQLIRRLNEPTGHIEDTFKVIKDLLAVGKKDDFTRRELRDLLWKHLAMNDTDKNAVKFIYNSKAFKEDEINGIKDRSIRPLVGTPYKDKALVVLTGAVKVGMVDKVLSIQKVTSHHVLEFGKEFEFKNVFDVKGAKKLADNLEKELKKLEKQLEEMHKDNWSTAFNGQSKDIKEIYADLFQLLFNSIIDRYALLKDSIYVLKSISSVA